MPIYRDVDKEDVSSMGHLDAAWNDLGSRAVHLSALVLCAFIIAFIAWAAWATVDEVTRGQGQVVPARRVQVIQHLEGGILGEVMVREGQEVQIGQPLARVDNVGAESQLRDLNARILEHRAATLRLNAELSGIPPVFPEEIPPNVVSSETNAYNSRVLKVERERELMQSQLEQKQQEMQEMNQRAETFRHALELAQRRSELARPMVLKKLYPEVDYLNLQQEVVRLQGEINAIANSIGKTELAVREAEQRLRLTDAEMRSQVIKELNERQSEMASLEQSMATGADRVTRTELRAPVRGIINVINLNTIGGVVKPGEPIMELVPLDDTLVVEAKIRPADIAFIHPGQKAIIKLTAYDSTIYGSLSGEVEQISADTLPGQNNEVHFLVKIRTAEAGLVHRGEKLPIMPGMVASVDILTGKKTVLTFLIKPIVRGMDNALRER